MITAIRGLDLPAGRGDLVVDEARGQLVDPAAPGAGAPDRSLDGTGYVAIPRLSDSHLHLDKCLLGSRWISHRTGPSIAARIALEEQVLLDPTLEPTAVRARRLVDLALSNGSTRLRSHVDLTPALGLRQLDALHEVRAQVQDRLDLTFVAFPQAGILTAPGTVPLLEAALEQGVEAIGGLDPTLRDGDRDGHLDVVFGLAVKYGVRVDIHLHEPGELGTSTMREIAACTAALGLAGRVAISHGYALGMVEPAEVDRTGKAMAQAGVALITNVPGGGKQMPVEQLVGLGVNVVFGSDNVRDSWSPFGKADMLERVALAGYLYDWDDDERLAAGLDRVTRAPAQLLGDEPALLRPGDPADFTLVPAPSVLAAIVSQPPGRVVYRAGQQVAGPALATPAAPPPARAAVSAD